MAAYTTLYEHGAALLFHREKKLRQINQSTNSSTNNSGDHVATVKITKINNNIRMKKMVQINLQMVLH